MPLPTTTSPLDSRRAPVSSQQPQPSQRQLGSFYTPGGNAAQTATGGGGGNWWSNLSPEMQATIAGGALNIGGGMLAGHAASKQQDENNAASAEQAALDRALRLYLAQQDQQQRQGELSLQNMQGRQQERQRQALAAAVLPQLRNASVQAPGDLGRFVPQLSGGLRLPEGGLSPETLAFWSPEARVAAESDQDRAAQLATGGRSPVPDYAAAGYGDLGMGPAAKVTDYAAKLREQAAGQAQQIGMQQAAQRMAAPRAGAGRQAGQSAPAGMSAGVPQQGPGQGSRVGNAALQFGLGYLGSRYGQGMTGNQSAWSGALGALGSYFGR